MRGLIEMTWIVVALMLAGLLWVPTTTTEAVGAAECVRPAGVQRIVFSASKYPNVRRNFRGALRRGWPRRLVVNRRGADARRERALRDIPTRDGFDRDEYPPAVGRGRWPGLERGRRPRGWKADVRYVPTSENRSHGASLGGQLERFCNGTRFRYVFR
jgi:Deoxyribonuclease NucA/NucB